MNTPTLLQRHRARVTTAALLLALAALPRIALSATSPSVAVPSVEARADDVASIDGLMRAFYEVVNVAPDAPRQWGRDRTLYSPWTRFVATSSDAKGQPQVDVWSHQQLVDETEPLVRRGFREREIHRRTTRYGHIAHIDSTYETELDGPGGTQRSRGVNSLELYFDGKRWWIASVMWMSESAQAPIPADLLP